MHRPDIIHGHLIRAAIGALFLSAAFAATGCDSMPWQDEGEAESASDEATGEDKGPCGQYASKVCKEAGERSQTCTQLTSTTELLPPEACEAALANVDFTLKKLGEKKAACDELTTKLCKDVGEKTATCAMVKDQTKQFPPERCDMMMQHYDEVVADLKRREEMNKPLPEAKAQAIATGDVPAFGPENAKVTIVEFSDFECPYCSRAANVAQEIKKKYGDRVRFVFRQYPLPMHPNAQEAAEASLAAHEQGKFWEFHDLLFANQRQLDRASLEKYAKETGLNVAAFKKALDEDKYAPTVKSDMKLGEDVSVQGTPTMFVNGKRVANPTSFETVSQMIEEELKG